MYCTYIFYNDLRFKKKKLLKLLRVNYLGVYFMLNQCYII